MSNRKRYKSCVVLLERILNPSEGAVKNYFKDVRDQKTLTREEEIDLIRKYKEEGDIKARDTVINANLRFVISVAKSLSIWDVDIMDLINEGNIGLINAIETFDYKTGNKFISYAVWHIRKEIMSFIRSHSSSIRIPENKLSNIAKMKKVINKQEQILGRNVYPDEIDFKDEIGEYTDFEIRFLENENIARPISYDKKIKSEEDSNDLLSLLSSNDNFEKNFIIKNDLKYILFRLLCRLDETTRKIILLYFGINDENIRYTYEEIAQKCNLTKKEVITKKNMGIYTLKKFARMKYKSIKEIYS
jgi:RNA polymerase primary sigma factor